MPNETSFQAEFLVQRGFFPDLETAIAAIVQMDANILQVMMNLAADENSDSSFEDSLDLD